MLEQLQLQSSYNPPTCPSEMLPAKRFALAPTELPADCKDRFDYDFDSPEALETFVAKSLRRGDGVWYGGLYHQGNNSSSIAWDWDREQILNLSHKGWYEVAAKIKLAAFSLATMLIDQHEQEVVVHDTSGAFVDVPRFIEGVPECMGQFAVAEQHGMRVTLVLDAFIRGGDSGNRVFLRGVATCAVLLALESLGIATTVILREVSKCCEGTTYEGRDTSGKRLRTGVILHQPGRTLDLSRMIVWLGHPGWTRFFLYDAEVLLTGCVNMNSAASPAEMSKGVFVMPGFGSESFNTDKGAEALLKQIMQTVA